MTIEPEPQLPERSFKSDRESEHELFPESPFEPYPQSLPTVHRIPNLGHAVIFLVVAAAVLFFVQSIAYSLAVSSHWFAHETAQQIMHDPRLVIPSMAAGYMIAGLAVWALFSMMWKLPFPLGVRWNGRWTAHYFYGFVFIGVLVSISVQLLSNYLPIPKTLPIDKFFRTTTDVWIIAIFGTFVAPVFEELAFRGFLFPALASAWDHVASGGKRGLETPPAEDPRWSAGSIVFATILTSIGFAMLHSSQLAHSWAPLAVLFSVSIVLCMVRLFSHSLAASALVHASYNATIFTLLYFASGGFHNFNRLMS